MATGLGSTSFRAGADPSPQGRQTRIHVICSPQGHVGTTLTARLLLDFFMSQSVTALGFDTNHLDPGLASIFPRDVATVDLSSTRGQMALFDSLIEDDKVTKVVDLWHVSYDHFFRQAEDIGFFQEARGRNLQCFILLQMDPKNRFAREIRTLQNRCPGAEVVLVENEELARLSEEPDSHGPASPGQRRLTIPRLDPVVRRLLTHPEILIHRFVCMLVPEELRTLQDQLRRALLPIFTQFEIIDVASELGLPVRSLLPRRPLPRA